MKLNILFASLIAIVAGLEKAVPPNQLAPINKGPVSSIIVGGNYASPGQIPYQVFVRMALSVSTNTYVSLCGGSLISERFILTAGHCVSGYVKFYIGMGSIYLNQPLTSMVSTQQYPHPQYTRTPLANDIALIKLPTIVSYNTATTYPIRLPSLSQQRVTFVGSSARVSGYGRTSNYADASTTLKYADLSIITNIECKIFFGSIITDSVICARRLFSTDSSCFGDSGGPIAVKEGNVWTLVGVVSFVSGAGCQTMLVPSGYARVSSHIGWINQVTGIPLRA